MENVEQNNILIAKFKGDIDIKNEVGLWYLDNIHELNYHESWNKLMPVVDKIEEFETKDGPVINTTWFYILGKGCWVEHANKKIALFCYEDGKPMTKLEATYLCVVEFIKWYNQNLPENK